MLDSDELWERIKGGEVLGFSIEGWFGETRGEMTMEDILFNKIKKILESENTPEEQYDQLIEILDFPNGKNNQ